MNAGNDRGDDSRKRHHCSNDADDHDTDNEQVLEGVLGGLFGEQLVERWELDRPQVEERGELDEDKLKHMGVLPLEGIDAPVPGGGRARPARSSVGQDQVTLSR